ncbi:uncharacterized protein [Misgurnus anguillicaudatus]|uniref:uncharacterized protein n=1 Tax=Misgurnus anguillicaudatus TaxID=75329 RepID=UPI003CCF7F93
MATLQADTCRVYAWTHVIGRKALESTRGDRKFDCSLPARFVQKAQKPLLACACPAVKEPLACLFVPGCPPARIASASFYFTFMTLFDFSALDGYFDFSALDGYYEIRLLVRQWLSGSYFIKSCSVSPNGTFYISTDFPAEAVTSTTKTKAVSTSTTPVGTTTTVMTTSVPLTTDISGTTPEDKDTEMWQIIWWSAVACSVIILTGLICLCGFACKKRSKRQRTAGESRTSGPANINSLITSVPDTSKPTGPKQPQSHQQSKPETYSLITSTSQPSDVLVNTQHKKGPTAENENVYHVYYTIPDKPVRAVAKHQTYSLAI